jgi:hypothetical protein
MTRQCRRILGLDAAGVCQRFFLWYDAAHCQAALGLMTPADVHYVGTRASWPVARRWPSGVSAPRC